MPGSCGTEDMFHRSVWEVDSRKLLSLWTTPDVTRRYHIQTNWSRVLDIAQHAFSLRTVSLLSGRKGIRPTPPQSPHNNPTESLIPRRH